MAQYRVPVVVEVILERVTNISMGSELDNVTEFEEIADGATDAPTETCFMKIRIEGVTKCYVFSANLSMLFLEYTVSLSALIKRHNRAFVA